jgi:hypothetical protein
MSKLESGVHLLTLVGGHVDVLPFMLQHYRTQQIDSFVVNANVPRDDDPLLADVKDATDRCGCGLNAVFVGDWQTFELSAWREAMVTRPNDWWVLADQDELHYHPDGLRSLLAYCDRNGYDSIMGGFVDRLSADGRFPAIDQSRPIWQQYPLGGVISSEIMAAYTMKVVAAKGHVEVSTGHHRADSGRPCPIENIFVQVHHFKWTDGVIERQRQRADTFRRKGMPYWTESDLFVQYCERNADRIDVDDPRFLLARCEPTYPHWSHLTARALAGRNVHRMA